MLLPWRVLIVGEGVGAAFAAATLLTGQRPGLTADRHWAVVSLLGAAILAAGVTCYIILLARLGRRPVAAVCPRAGLSLLPGLAAGVIALAAALHGDLALTLQAMPRLRALLGLTLAGGTAVAMWVALWWIADDARGWLQAVYRRLGPTVTVGIATFLLFVAVGGGHLYSPDEWASYAVTHALVTRASLLVRDGDPFPLTQMGIQPVGTDERTGQMVGYSKWPVLPSVAAIPAYVAARMVGSQPDRASERYAHEKRGRPLVALAVGPLWGAMAVMAVAWLARRVGYGLTPILVVTALSAFATPWWPYTKTLLNVLPAGAFLVLAVGATYQARRGSLRWSAAAGLAAGLAAASRYELVLATIPLGITIVVSAYRASRPPPRPSHGGRAGESFHPPVEGEGSEAPPSAMFAHSYRSLVRLAAFAAGCTLVVAAGVLLPNVIRTGEMLNFGYGGQQTLAAFSAKPHLGIYAILLSPGFGLFIYAPILILGTLSLVWLWEDAPGLAATIGAIAIMMIVLYGSASEWRGGMTWGPRYLVPVMLLLCLPVAAFIQRNGRNPLAMATVLALGLWGAVVNGLAVLFDFNHGWQNLWTLGADLWNITWTPQFSLIGAQLRLLRLWYGQGQGDFDLYLAHALGWPVVVILVAAALVLVVALARAGAHDHRNTGTTGLRPPGPSS